MTDYSTIYKTDECFAGAFQNSDQVALGALYEKYSPILFRVLQKMTANTTIAEEILKACFIHIWRTKQTYKPSEERLVVWVFRTAIDTANNLLENQTNSTYVGNQNSSYKDWKTPTLIMELIISGHITQEEAAEKMQIPVSELRQLLRKEINQLRRP
jgi:DNA-directed RNA polymerase specialized sigma24 family protein